MAVLRCTAAFAFVENGAPRVLRPGDLVDESDPAVKGREVNFEPVEVTVARSAHPVAVESATAAPGEKRSTVKPAKDA